MPQFDFCMRIFTAKTYDKLEQCLAINKRLNELPDYYGYVPTTSTAKAEKEESKKLDRQMATCMIEAWEIAKQAEICYKKKLGPG